ncbi:MAG: insulinase family protein [Bacteroidetes bacterium]|nr:insulinase family protein [Bacteroidota bacterium]
MKIILLAISAWVIISVMTLAPVLAQPELIIKVEGTGEFDIPYEKWKLPNGLTVIVSEDHSDPICHVQVLYHVGSSREELGKSGFAHFFEHMLFQGSKHVGDEEHFKIVSDAGGSSNGFTQRDFTVYIETVPSNQVEVALWLEADRMGFLLEAVTKEKFEIQRKTVKNEKFQNQVNRPYGLTGEVLGKTLYPPTHPYSWPVIGYVDDLDRVTVDDLKDFFLRWYGPNNATLTVTGDVDPKQIVELANKYFGSINPGPVTERRNIPLPVLPVDRFGNFEDNVYFPLTLMVFPTPGLYHRDEAPLDILADMMGDGKSSLFYKNFVKTEDAVNVNVYNGADELAGEFTFRIVAYPEFSFQDIEKKIRETLEQFEKEGMTQGGIDRAKAKITSQIVDNMENVFSKSYALSRWNVLISKPWNYSNEMDRYNKVTLEDVQKVYRKYIKGKNSAIVNVYPRPPMSEDTTESVNPNANIKVSKNPNLLTEGMGEWKYIKPKDDFDRSMKPVPGAPKKPIIPDFYVGTFDNGIKMIGAEDHEIPKVVVILDIEGGDKVLEKDQIGLSRLTAAVMDEATDKYSAEDFEKELDLLGSRIFIRGGTTQTSIRLECFSDKLDASLKLLEERLLHPKFDDKDFKRIRKQVVGGLQQQKKDAGTMARWALNGLLHQNSIIGTHATDKNIKKLKLQDCFDYYNKYYDPSVTDLVIVGDVTEAQIKPKLEFLNKWEKKNVEIPNMAAPTGADKTAIYVVQKPYAKQSMIRIGQP